MKSYREILQEAERKLRESGIPEAKLDAWYLFEAEFHMSRAEYLMRQEEEPPEVPLPWQDKLQRRCERVPLQYILGYTEFMGLPFQVGPGVLIPRQDTETLVELVLHWEDGLPDGRVTLLDLCTGSGCIGLSLAVMNPRFSVTLADASGDALAFARKNRDSLCPNVAVYEGDLFAAVPESEKYDVIVSNPPYIATSVVKELQREVKDYEPGMALDGRKDGLFFYRRIAGEGKAYMKPGARIYLEIGYDQGEAVPKILREAGYTDVTVHRDLAGLNRVVRGVYQDV